MQMKTVVKRYRQNLFGHEFRVYVKYFSNNKFLMNRLNKTDRSRMNKNKQLLPQNTRQTVGAN